MTQSALKSILRVGQISYTNCLPFYHRLQDYSFARAVPTQVNQAMRRGEVEMAPISSLEYLINASEYYLLPGICIAARDFSGSVILFSKEKIESLDGKNIAVTDESLSSSVLLKILLKFKYKFENTFSQVPSNPEAMLQKFPAALVIGDDALFYKPKEFVYKYDLAELWWQWTGKPFCFALWAVRRQYADKNPAEVAAFLQALKENLERNLMDLEQLIKEAAQLTFLDEKFSKVFGYLFNLNYGLNEEIKEGLELFYRLAHRLKAASKLEKLHFFKV